MFKFYLIVWILFALAGMQGLAEVWQASRPAPTRAVRAPRRRRLAPPLPWWQRPAWAAAGRIAAAGILVLAVWSAADVLQVLTGTPYLAWVLAASILAAPWVFAWRPDLPWVRRTYAGILAAAVFAAGLYAPLSLYNRMRLCSEFKHPTLNGMAYLERLNPQEVKALAWLNEHVRRTDVVLEAPGRQGYNCFDTRVAIFTGQPTLIGWIGQEEQMRYQPALTDARVRDADLIYGTPDPRQAQALLDKYRVTYVMVGLNERKAYPGPGLDKFARFMNVAYADDGVIIYRRRP